ncbi:hypothetical protein CYMTET_29286 [Cymbomonas tetramitiformis]|uniref:Uncharacterized protein n=1 Tax=Cymbomonas tetramitiformis TaxID=36881 RepID=A0AAE0FLR4_9CHLO|nr:hypothetical protein CYMTET_29286 [Cymbomonas tetramitiformis]
MAECAPDLWTERRSRERKVKDTDLDKENSKPRWDASIDGVVLLAKGRSKSGLKSALPPQRSSCRRASSTTAETHNLRTDSVGTAESVGPEQDGKGAESRRAARVRAGATARDRTRRDVPGSDYSPIRQHPSLGRASHTLTMNPTAAVQIGRTGIAGRRVSAGPPPRSHVPVGLKNLPTTYPGPVGGVVVRVVAASGRGCEKAFGFPNDDCRGWECTPYGPNQESACLLELVSSHNWGVRIKVPPAPPRFPLKKMLSEERVPLS